MFERKTPKIKLQTVYLKTVLKIEHWRSVYIPTLNVTVLLSLNYISQKVSQRLGYISQILPFKAGGLISQAAEGCQLTAFSPFESGSFLKRAASPKVTLPPQSSHSPTVAWEVKDLPIVPRLKYKWIYVLLFSQFQQSSYYRISPPIFLLKKWNERKHKSCFQTKLF